MRIDREKLRERLRKHDRTIFFVKYDYLLEHHYYLIRKESIYILWAGCDIFDDLNRNHLGSIFQEELITGLEKARSSGSWEAPKDPSYSHSIEKLEILDPRACLTNKSKAVRKAAKYCLGEKNYD